MNLNQNSSPIKFNPGRDGSDGKSAEVKHRPTGGARGRKDFEKVLDSDTSSDDSDTEAGDMGKSKGIKDEGADFVLVDDPSLKKQAPPSLFDLSGGKGMAKPTNENSKVDSPSDLYAKLSSGKKIGDEGDKFTTRFATEQADLSYVNPMAAATLQPIQSAAFEKSEAVHQVNLQAIIDQLVDKVVELKANDTTETTITLKYPPMFEGTNIVVTSFDSAKGQFNISFENLTQQAKNILDQQANRQSLMSSLEQKGYAVHIVHTTTLVEHKPIIADVQPNRNPDRERRDQDQRQQKRQRNQEEQ